MILREIFCLGSDMNQDAFNPGDEKAKEIAEKLMRGRQRIAEEKGKETGSPLAKYVSILTIGLNSMPLKDVINLTFVGIFLNYFLQILEILCLFLFIQTYL